MLELKYVLMAPGSRLVHPCCGSPRFATSCCGWMGPAGTDSPALAARRMSDSRAANLTATKQAATKQARHSDAVRQVGTNLESGEVDHPRKVVDPA